MALLNMVAMRIHGESVIRFEKLWSQFDVIKNGVITENEFVNVAMAADKTLTEAKARAMFRTGDVDASGELHFIEFMALMTNANTLTHDDVVSAFKSLFSECARTNGGKVTAAQFLSVFPNALGEHKASVDKLFREIDRDSNGRIDVEEFVTFIDSM